MTVDPNTPPDIELSEPGTAERGMDVIAAFVRTLPNKPGVYRMLNEAGDVLYVGKARNLKKRVLNYTRLAGHTSRIARMILQTASMEFITTASEAEALLLEANLIKKLRPRFNVLLRDDKSFPYILIARNHQIAQIRKHRGARSYKGEYFGPFASAGAVNRTINALQKAFLLRSCSDSVYENRTRPCLLYQIKRCAAPCTGEISEDGYNALVDDALDFLSGRSQRVKDTLARQMEKAAEALEFEQAARYRDRISALSHVQSHQGINPQSVTDADVFAIADEGGQSCIQVFFFRSGQNWGNRAYYPRADKSHSSEEILEAFLAQFYDDKPCPKLIILPKEIAGQALLADALSVKSERKVKILVPQRGEKRTLVEHATSNAREALGRRMAEAASQTKLLNGVAETFDLEAPPRRIEVYDNSHIQGAHAVGAMIVAGPEGFQKSQYRKFNIKSQDISAGDDFAMMKEVLTRRFSRLLKEEGSRDNGNGKGEDTDHEAMPPWPDLVLIDGGKGQLSAAQDVLADLGIEDLPVAGIAKGPDRNAGREHFYIQGKQPFMLESRDPVLYYIQRLRDEAHRFAIGSHRARRKKAIGANPLDEISGIGPGRKKALLRHFGSARAVSRASVTDLSSVEGISSALAKHIFKYFHDQID
ncbi:MAG: excinuclease ABC subunit UvrC [Hyphomicrobiales bacterium]